MLLCRECASVGVTYEMMKGRRKVRRGTGHGERKGEVRVQSLEGE